MSGILGADHSLRRGQELLRAGLENAALEHFAQAHRARPEDPRLRSYYGWAVATVEHRLERGLGLCREALRDDGGCAEIYLNLARVLMSHGRKAEGIRYLKRGLMVDPREAALIQEWRRLGVRRRHHRSDSGEEGVTCVVVLGGDGTGDDEHGCDPSDRRPADRRRGVRLPYAHLGVLGPAIRDSRHRDREATS
jgi:tetratricopeptide (TPR) repeat protein